MGSGEPAAEADRAAFLVFRALTLLQAARQLSRTDYEAVGKSTGNQ
jgi:hypothetical protein